MRRLVALVVVVACSSPPAARPLPSNASAPQPVPEPTTTPTAPAELIGRIVKVEVTPGAVMVTLPFGSDHGVTKAWSGEVLDATTDAPLPGGSLVTVRINHRATVLRSSLAAAQLTANPHVRLHP